MDQYTAENVDACVSLTSEILRGLIRHADGEKDSNEVEQWARVLRDVSAAKASLRATEVSS